MKKFLHWVSHKLGWNEGKVVSWRDNNKIYIGFRCDYCETIDSKTINIIEMDVEDDSIIETK